MAKMSPKGKITGVSGPVYFRSLNNVQIVQSRPNRSKQDKGKNPSAKLFKHTAQSLRHIRKHVEYFLGMRYESTAHLRLMGLVMTALRKNTVLPIAETTLYNTSIAEVVGFEWNTTKLFTDTFLVDIAVDELENKEIIVSVAPFIPIEQVDFPPMCTHASLRIEGFFMTDTDEMLGKQTSALSIDFKKSDDVVSPQPLSVLIPHRDCLKMVVAEIQFFYPINNNPNQLTLYNTKAFNPSVVVYVGR
ncbi:hypothetical protein [Myroides odoratimimus]|uniref:hypothetical protein n=1 Tax=Myroides odoratimimus TaxID=76832 RepID=UPI0025778573|nr:hypothetical protein [Myroides odoratimimus]MDM1325814.1 hypothetical protein [Myroides odoratimimus]